NRPRSTPAAGGFVIQSLDGALPLVTVDGEAGGATCVGVCEPDGRVQRRAAEKQLLLQATPRHAPLLARLIAADRDFPSQILDARRRSLTAGKTKKNPAGDQHKDGDGDPRDPRLFLRDLSKGCHGDSSVRVIVSPVEVGVWRAVWIAPTYVVVHTRRQSLDSLISEQEEVLAIVPRKLIERVSSPDDFLRM